MCIYILAILTFKNLKSVSAVLFLVTFLLLNITGVEYAENTSFVIPEYYNLFIS